MSTRPFWILTLGGALVATVCTYWARSHSTPALLEPVVDALNVVHTAAVVFGSVLSPNHDPSLALEYCVLFATYALLLFIFLCIVRLLNR